MGSINLQWFKFLKAMSPFLERREPPLSHSQCNNKWGIQHKGRNKSNVSWISCGHVWASEDIHGASWAQLGTHASNLSHRSKQSVWELDIKGWGQAEAWKETSPPKANQTFSKYRMQDPLQAGKKQENLPRTPHTCIRGTLRSPLKAGTRQENQMKPTSPLPR